MASYFFDPTKTVREDPQSGSMLGEGSPTQTTEKTGTLILSSLLTLYTGAPGIAFVAACAKASMLSPNGSDEDWWLFGFGCSGQRAA